MKLRLPRFGWDDGGSAVDAAFSMLLLTVFIVGIFEFAFGYWVLNSSQLAVEQGGRWAIAHHICPIGGGSAYPNCAPSGTAKPPGTCLDPTASSDVTPTVQQVVYGGLPGAAALFGSDANTVVQTSWGVGGIPCPATPSASSPPTLQISVAYVNGFLNMFGYSLGAADTVPLQ